MFFGVSIDKNITTKKIKKNFKLSSININSKKSSLPLQKIKDSKKIIFKKIRILTLFGLKKIVIKFITKDIKLNI